MNAAVGLPGVKGSKRTRDQRTTSETLRNSYTFPSREHSKNIFENKGNFGKLSREHGPPLGVLQLQYLYS